MPPLTGLAFFLSVGNMKEGYLHLIDGTVISGQISQRYTGFTPGEVVFTTGMTGYYESLTDPSYAGQILVFTYPLIGNYGIPNASLWESSRVHASGVIVGEACTHWSHSQGLHSLAEWLQEQGIPLMTAVDTRHVTKRLREAGVMRGCISSQRAHEGTFEDSDSQGLVQKVSLAAPRCYGDGPKRIILVDCGMKANILRCLQNYPLSIKQVPYDYDYCEEPYDGVFLSNGPGDPQDCVKTINVLRRALGKGKPVYGICLGAQLLALAAGAKTYKLHYGHRGHNQPCIETKTSRCYMTSQNHGYAIDDATLPDDWCVTFRSLNDNSVEGISHRELPYHAVQFHPESAPGPTDTQWFFEQFYASL